ncbi:MAG: hypothetical protein ACOYXC_17375 [Candidatus Rifleibacteriota bacterium]
MLWFFAFTGVGIAVFAFFLAVKSMVRIPFLKIISGSVLLGLTGLLAARVSTASARSS